MTAKPILVEDLTVRKVASTRLVVTRLVEEDRRIPDFRLTTTYGRKRLSQVRGKDAMLLAPACCGPGFHTGSLRGL